MIAPATESATFINNDQNAIQVFMNALDLSEFSTKGLDSPIGGSIIAAKAVMDSAAQLRVATGIVMGIVNGVSSLTKIT
jgi:hypothetical protein